MHTTSALPSPARQSMAVRTLGFLLPRRIARRIADALNSGARESSAPESAHAVTALRGLRRLYLIECLAGAAMYLLSSVLVLYLADVAGLQTSDALRAVATVNALCCLGPLLGGWLADRYLGLHRSVLLGAATITTSLLLLALPQVPLRIALTLLIIGCALFRSNVIALAGELARAAGLPVEPQYRRVYVAYNIGATVSPLFVAALLRWVGWSGLFLSAALGMASAVVLLCLHVDMQQPSAATASKTASTTEPRPAVLAATPPPVQTIIALLLALALWAACIGQSDGTMLIWARDHTRPALLGLSLSPSVYMALPALLVALCAPLSSLLERFEITRATSRRLLLGMMATACAMAIVATAAWMRPIEPGSPLPLLVCYALIGAAEILVVPIVQNLLAQHLPAQRAGVALALSYAALAVGFYLAGLLGSLSQRASVVAVFAGLFVLALCSGGLMARVARGERREAAS